MAYISMKCCELYSAQILHVFTGEQFPELLQNSHTIQSLTSEQFAEMLQNVHATKAL